MLNVAYHSTCRTVYSLRFSKHLIYEFDIKLYHILRLIDSNDKKDIK